MASSPPNAVIGCILASQTLRCVAFTHSALGAESHIEILGSYLILMPMRNLPA